MKNIFLKNLLYFFVLTSIANLGATEPDLSQPIEITDGWFYRWGDSPVDSTGTLVWLKTEPQEPGWHLAESIHRPSGKSNNEFFLWLAVKLPAAELKFPVLYLPYVHLAFQTYIDRELIYESGEMRPAKINQYVSFNRNFLQLTPGQLGKTIYFRIFSNFPEFHGIHTRDDYVMLGSQYPMLIGQITRDIGSSLLGIVFILIGALAFIIFLRRFKRKDYYILSFALFVISIGFFYVLKDRPSQFVIDEQVRYYLGLVSFVFFPVGLFAFFEQIIKHKMRKMIRWFWTAHLVLAIVLVCLDLIGILPLPLSQNYFLFLFMFTITGAFIIGVVAAFTGDHEAKILIAGFVVFGLIGLHDILAGLGILDTEIFLSHWGVLIFILTLGYILERRFFSHQEKLEEYSQELEKKVTERTVALQSKNGQLETALEQLQETQNQLVLKEKMASLGNLVAGVAHEVNNPVGAVVSAADVSKRCIVKIKGCLSENLSSGELQESKQFQKAIYALEQNNEIANVASQRVTKIVRSLKNFARLDEAELQKADIHEGLDSTLTLLHHQIKNRIEVAKNYGDLPMIECFPNQLNQVFMNLLMNASQAIEDKGEIKIETSAKNNQVEIKISDSGKGIPADKVDKIFDPGFTTKGVGVGTGLGLSISYNIIEKHNGSIGVESEPGKGATLKIVLPIENGNPG